MSLALIRAEILKVTSTRVWWALLIGVVLLTAVGTLATAAFAGAAPEGSFGAVPAPDDPRTLQTIYGSGWSGAYLFALIIGIIGMTGEYRYQTVTPTFLSTPTRTPVVLAKLVAHFGVGLVYGVIAAITAVVSGAIVLSVRGFDLGLGAEGVWRSILLSVLAVALWALLGLGLGTLIRNQVVAILIALAVTVIVEPLLTVVFNQVDIADVDLSGVVAYLPSNASTAIFSGVDAGFTLLAWWAGALVLMAYAVVMGSVGVVLSQRRDVT